MKKLRFLLLVPLFSVNTLFILMGGCFSNRSLTCAYFNHASVSVWDNADSIPQPAQAAGVLAGAMYLELALTDTSYTCSTRPLVAPNTAYAHIEPNIRFDSIIRVSITSSSRFDSAHPAGSELKDLFYHKGYSDTLSRYTSSARYLLLHAPDDTGTHIFTIRLVATDSTKNLTVVSPPVKLLL